MVDFEDNWAHIPKANALVTVALLESAAQLHGRALEKVADHSPPSTIPTVAFGHCGRSCGLPTALRANKEWPTLNI